MRRKTSINLEDAGDNPDEIDNDPPDEDTSRRDFLKVAGATTTAGAMGTLAGCTGDGGGGDGDGGGGDSGGSGSVLIAYLTRTKNTKAVAEIIQQEVGGDMVEVESEEPYPENYDAIVAQVAEENESGYTPPLKTKVENIQAYDAVFFGFPTWDMQLPPPMKSFLRERDLSGKNVVPFNTNGGYGVGSSFQTIEDRCPNSDVLEGFSTRGGSETDGIYLAIEGERREEVHAEVTDWLQNIQV